MANARWRLILNPLERYLDAESLLTLRACASVFRTHRFKLGGPVGARVIRFSSLRGFDGQLIVERLLKMVLASLNPNVRSEGIELDLSNCVGIRDAQLAYLVTTSPHFVPSPQPDAKSLFTKLTALRLDFCPQVSDKGIAALLSAHLPHLGSLSLRCIRSQALNGSAFIDGLTPTLWPKFRRLNVDFTSFSLEALTAIAEFITERSTAKTVREAEVSAAAAHHGTPNETTQAAPPTLVGHSHGTAAPTPAISFVGSWASKCYLEAIGAKHLIKALALALNACNPAEVAEVSERAQQEIDQLVLGRLLTDPLAPYVVGQGSKLLMNVPVTCPTSEEGGVNVWTLPISVAVLNGRIDVVDALTKAGAEIDVVDHLGKSPLVRAVASGDYEMTKYLLGLGVQMTPHNVLGPSALNVAIERRDIRIARLLLEKEFPLNLKCPAVKTFKSPLHVACEVADEALIHSLLDWGANPNTISGTYKNSPAMLAYKVNPRFLPVFLQGGPGGSLKSVPLCSEILTAAIAKEDLRSAELLLSLFPQLMTRQHPTWSCPHIQAAKMGKMEMLDGLLATYRSSLTSRKQGASPLASVEVTNEAPVKRFHHPLNCIHHSKECTHRLRPPPLKKAGKNGGHEEELAPYSRLSSNTFEQRLLVLTTMEGHQNSSTRADSAKLPRSAPFPQSSPARVPIGQALDPALEAQNITLAMSGAAPTGGVADSSRRTSSKIKFWGKRSSGTGLADGFSMRDAQASKTRDGSKTTIEERPPVPDRNGGAANHVAVAGSSRRLSARHPHCWLTKMQDLLSIRDSTTGHTALHYVAEDGQLDCLKVLLKYGAVIDLRNAQGQTPLHCACYENRRDVAEFLIAHGSRLNQRDCERLETPLMVCIRTRNDSLALMIIKYMKIRERHGHVEPEDDVYLRTPDNTGLGPTADKRQSVLHYAIYYQRYDIVNKLLSLDSCVQNFLNDEEGMRASCAFVLERLPSVKDPRQQHIMRKVIRLCQKYERRKLADTQQRQLENGIPLATPKSVEAQEDRNRESLTSSQPLGDVPSSSPSLASSRSMGSGLAVGDGAPASVIPASDSSCYCYCVECLGFLGSDCSDMGAFLPPGQEGDFDEASSSSSRSGNDDDLSSQEDAIGSVTRNRSSRLRRARDKMKLAAKKPFQMFAKNRSLDGTN